MFHGRRGRTPLIGPATGLIQLHGSSSTDVSRPVRHSKKTYLSGRVQAQRGPRPRREWSVSVASAYPEHVQVLRQLEAGLLAGPYVFYDELAQVSNLLSPQQSMLAAGTWSGSSTAYQGGAGVAADGTVYLRSIAAEPSGTVEFFADSDRQLVVPPGFPLTASVYVSAFAGSSVAVALEELDAEGATITTHRPNSSVGAVGERVVVSVVTDSRTRYVRFRTFNALMTTLPCLTLTDAVMPWVEGLGCRSVAIELPGHAVNKAVPSAEGRRIAYEMTVQELG